jgi:hypothetical protein
VRKEISAPHSDNEKQDSNRHDVATTMRVHELSIRKCITSFGPYLIQALQGLCGESVGPRPTKSSVFCITSS